MLKTLLWMKIIMLCNICLVLIEILIKSLCYFVSLNGSQLTDHQNVLQLTSYMQLMVSEALLFTFCQ